MIIYLYNLQFTTCGINISIIVAVQPNLLDAAIEGRKSSVNANLIGKMNVEHVTNELVLNAANKICLTIS